MNFARNCEKNIILGTSDAWPDSRIAKILLFNLYNVSLEFHMSSNNWVRHLFLGNWNHVLQQVFIFSHLYQRERLRSYKFWCTKLNRFLTISNEVKQIFFKIGTMTVIEKIFETFIPVCSARQFQRIHVS